MRRSLLFILILLFSGVLFAQQNKINVVISIKCTNAPQFSIWNDTIREGQKYEVKPANLAAPYNIAQALYNSIVGSYFIFEDGCINQDIQVRITLNNVDCSNGLFTPANAQALFFFWRVEVFDFTGVDPLPSPYNFNSPSVFKLVLKKSGLFNAFCQLSGLNPAELLAFAYMTVTGSFTTSGITTQNYNDSLVARISHFSDIVGGKQQGLVSVEDPVVELPTAFGLDQNYPNPFNPSTTIKYSVPERADVVLRVYDVMGVEVARLVNDTKEAGEYEVKFDASGLPSGLYLYELRAGSVVLNKKMLLVK